MGLFYLILIAFGLRVAAAVLMPVMSWDDSYTWWILAIETKNNSLIYTDPWKEHDTIFPPLYPVVSALFMALFSSENIWAPRSISIASGGDGGSGGW